MAVTQNSYIVGSASGGYGGSTAGPYPYSFPLIADTDVAVIVDGQTRSLTTHYTHDSGNSRITFVSGQEPSSGSKVIVYRDTDEDPINATFNAGSTIRAVELNDNFKQVLYIAQETENQALSTLGGTMSVNLDMGIGTKINFEGATDNAYETTLTVVDPTADRTITLPNVTGTVITTGDTGTVNSTMITDGTIVAGDIANATITGSKLVNDTVTATQIAANAVTASELADNAVDTNAVADDAVTYAKIQNVTATDRILGRDSSGAGIVEEIAPAALRTMINVEDGATADQTNAEIRAAVEAATDSNVFTDADHTKLNAIESNATADQTVSEIKALLASDNLDASHLAANSVTTSEIADAELVTLASMPSGTASVLADSTALTSTTAELNLLDGKSIVTSVSGSSTDVQLPTAKAVNDQIVALTQAAGGFYPIDDELKFPNTNPDPNNDAGTIVSIADAGGIVVNGSGVSTTGRTLGGATVTINGIDSSLNNTTIAAGKGMLVQTTSTLNTYDYHRLTLDEAGVASAQTLVTDFNERYRVNAGEPSSSLHEGDLVYDTNADKMKVYDTTTSAWKEVTSTGDFKYLFLCPAGGSGAPTINGSIATYDLREGSNSGAAASVTSAAQLIVSVNGVIQKANTGTSAPAEGFALVDANTIVFGTNLPSGASVFITQTGSAVSIPTPGDNTVSTVKIQNLAVTTGKIADQAVDLTKLPHGDGSSNGKFLRSNNGADPTWETVSTTPEGTAILSTGESGGTKFLREDGDGTSSWQTVVGAVADNCIYENDQTISNNYTIASGKGAHSVGPITVNATVTVNGNWVVS